MTKMLFRKKESLDMTEGKILPLLIRFAIPLLIGNLFQQFYNMVDTWVVGNFASNEAFSAVGSSAPIINMVIGFFVGFSSGNSVVISQYYGAGKTEEVRKTVHTSYLSAILFGVVITVVGTLLTPTMIRLMKIPEEVRPESQAYLSIYFLSAMAVVIYNIGAGCLRAIGDSRRPLYFLIVTSIANVVLDLVLVKPLGVSGVALATAIAQMISAVLVTVTLVRSNTCLRLDFRKLRIHWDIFKKILFVGFPSGLQMVITAFSNVFVQSYINVYGADYMSGWTAYHKLDALLLLPMHSFSLAATTFVGQNLGKNQVDRAKKGSNVALAASFVTTLLLLIPLVVFPEELVGFFNKKPEVIEVGAMLVTHVTPFYLVCTVNQVYAAALRGSGNSRAPMIILLASYVVFRQIYLFIVSRLFPGSFLAVALGYPAGWILCSVLIFIYYCITPMKSRLIETEEKKPAEEASHS